MQVHILQTLPPIFQTGLLPTFMGVAHMQRAGSQHEAVYNAQEIVLIFSQQFPPHPLLPTLSV